MPNKGNGSQTDSYLWTQTLEEINVAIPMEQGIKSKHLKVNIGLESVHVAKKDGSKVYLEGKWSDKIDLDDTTWTLITENGQRTMEILITKYKNNMTWWDSLIEGE